ncbi:hypothetical protein EDC04DRAFT_2747774 [Pisolithus marmoratus]|nr:hypothetical protein EDC04DRAFT_2747774 [Pisolithus marmoratus]
MTFGCFSRFWCCWQLPSPSEDVIETFPMPPSSCAPIHLDPHFHILVMGQANAGKMTILQRVCNTMDQPEIWNGQGSEGSLMVRSSLE